MASNALSKRRGPLRRPKVCHTTRNPGRCEPDPPACDYVCSLEPPAFETLPDEPNEIDAEACCEALPEEEIIAIAWEATGGELIPPPTVMNCSSATSAQWTGDEGPGVFTITATFTFSDGHQCVAVSVATVVSEE